MENLLGDKLLEINLKLQNLIENFDEINLNKGVTITTEIKVLHTIFKQNKATPTQLIQSIGIAKGNLAILCNSMINKGLIKKTKCLDDKRIVCYTLTEKGKNSYVNTCNTIYDNFSKVLAYKNNLSKITSTVDKLLELITN